MADSIYLGTKAKSFSSSPRFSNYDMVVLNIDENNYISSPHVTLDTSKWTSKANGEHVFTYNGSAWEYDGNTYTTAQLSSTYGITITYSSVTEEKTGDTVTVSKITNDGTQTVTAELTRSGRMFEVDCPLVKASERQSVADSLLAKVYGFSYQPYEADGAMLNPAAELGDAITAFGVYGGLYKQSITFGRLMCSSIGAPADEEIDSEFTFKTAQERRYARKFADIAAEFSIQADQISAKVSKVDGDNSSFGWSLTASAFRIFSGSKEVFRINSSGARFAGTVRANQIETGTITIGSTTFDAGYITGGANGQIATGTITGGSGGNIGSGTVSYGNVGFTGTLDQVGVNKSNIEAMEGYFTGSATFSNLKASVIWLANKSLYFDANNYVRGQSYS